MTLVLEAADLCAQEKAVLLAITNHTDATGKTFAGEQRLMREAGMPRTTFQRWRSKLVERDLLISRDKRNDRNQRLTSDTWVNLSVLRGMRDPFFERAGRTAAEEDENPFSVSAGQDQAPPVEPGDDVQAPSVDDPGPTGGAWLGPASGAPNPQMNPPSSIARADEAVIGSVAADPYAERDDDARTTGMNPDQFAELVDAVTALRPEWQAPGIRAQVAQVAHLPYELVREAFLESAGDRKFYTPMHLASAANDRVVQVERKAAKDEERERDQDDWRRQVHEDVSNRADPVTRARYLADLKRVAQEKRSASKVAAAGA